MKLSQLIQMLQHAQSIATDDPEVVLCFEPGVMEEGFSWEGTEGISDVRLAADWPLPGKSLAVAEHEQPSKVIIFYDNHFNLDCAEP